MDPNSVDLETAAKGLTLLALIPTVMFSLWADYIERNPSPNPEEEGDIQKIRTVSFIIIFFQITLFLESTDIRDQFPLYTLLSLAGVVVTQIISQTATERKLRLLRQDTPISEAIPSQNKQPEQVDPVVMDQGGPLLKAALRVGLLWLIGGSAYLFLVISSVKLAFKFAQALHTFPSTTTLICFLGGAIGVVIGLFLNLVLSPLYLKFVFPVHSIENNETKNQLEKCFEKSHFCPQFCIISIKNIQITDIIFSGISVPFLPIKPAVFISQLILNLLEPRELKALVLTQVSHVSLHHIRKRFLFSLGLIITSISFGIGFVFLSHSDIAGKLMLEALIMTVTCLSLIISFRLVASQIKHQETVADIHSIEILGGSLNDLSNALKKLSQQNQLHQPNSNDLDYRIAALTHHFQQAQDSDTDFNSKAS